MPRIDPLSLLRCLSVLLSPTGGIKSKDEVIRLANLMTKFSKKLVSKCIYIQILKSSSPDLLDQFMAAGGWGLIHVWLSDGIQYKNYALIEELLELLLLCPVNVERLKSNNCPKLIKGLSKNSHMGVRTLASRLVEQWLKMVKGEATPTNTLQTPDSSCSSYTSVSETLSVQQYNSHTSLGTTVNQNTSENASSVHLSDPSANSHPQSSLAQSVNSQHQIKNISPQTQPQTPNSNLEKPQSTPKSTSPLYKITIRDGKQVLTQMQTDASNINLGVNLNVNTTTVNNTDVNGDIVNSAICIKNEGQKIEESENSFAKVNHDELSVNNFSEVSEVVIKSDFDTEVSMTDAVSDDKKEEKNEINKSISNKENRDKKEDKKSSSSSDKKSSSSKSSSKHSSGSSKHSSSKHSSSSQRSSSKSSSSSRDKSSRDKDKDRHHSSSSSKSSSSKSKSDRDKDRDKEKEKVKKDQAEKDKATLEKLQSQTLSTKMMKIPKKKADEEKAGDSPSRKSSSDSKDSFKENKDKSDTKKIISVPEKKNISMSIENRKITQDSNSRPKTVKTFNSKFRSTGLEEEIKPIPSRGAKKLATLPDKKVLPPKLSLKRSSPNRESGSSAEKKPRLSLDSPTTPPNDEKKGGIKLIPAKPKLVFLQESDMFMDALTASTTRKEPKKKKRRTSISKDGNTESKKHDVENHRDGSSSPMSPPHSNDDKSIVASKPALNFYQDTLETDEEKSKTKEEDTSLEDMDTSEPSRVKNDDGGSRTPTPENDFDDEKSSESPEDPAAAVTEALKKEQHDTVESRPIGVLKSVLLLQKRKGPKKSLKWKTDLESIRYFELDETERVNVTKTFTDMKNMEKMNEREAFQMARKLSSEDIMEEKTVWKPLIPIDLPPPLVEPGKDSLEKNIQYAREKGILQALYFHRSMIPDSAAEPDEERHHVFAEPKIIPLDDLTGNKESEKDFSSMPWPEPKPQLPAPATTMQATYFQTFRSNQPTPMPNMATQPPIASVPQKPIMNSMQPMVPEVTATMPVPAVSGGGWRTGDGKLVVPDPNLSTMPPMTNSYPPNMENPSMVPPNMMGPPPQMFSPEGYMMAADETGYNNYHGPPPGPAMYGPPGPGGPPGPPFQGPRPPMHGNRGRGGPGWFRGGPPRGMPWRGGWRGNGKTPPVCRQFSKNGYCRVGDKCQFLHPGVNCPPY